MTRAQVRDGIATFFGGPFDAGQRLYRGGPLHSYGLATVRSYFAKRVPDTDYTAGLEPGRAMGTVGVVHLGDAVERRTAIGGATGGWKARVYSVSLHLYHLATTPTAEQAQADLDELLEAAAALIHGDRTLGEVVLQAGESTNGIRFFLGQPAYGPGTEHIRTYASLTFDADVYIQA
ncbi:hypothetical protein DQ384_38205 [Sphaerisporangium album]|uniref:DUF3168 domain-containing protein n=1 Tax=Sphaerisporangium album TaxID=509200 RepID=A0A367ENE3_9ACTN|nr:hypothetical protein [Sphaerisporangium album]RCG19115.1 hypothetical protein DQ384_38205 [Sphaerisporangium album]